MSFCQTKNLFQKLLTNDTFCVIISGQHLNVINKNYIIYFL